MVMWSKCCPLHTVIVPYLLFKQHLSFPSYAFKYIPWPTFLFWKGTSFPQITPIFTWHYCLPTNLWSKWNDIRNILSSAGLWYKKKKNIKKCLKYSFVSTWDAYPIQQQSSWALGLHSLRKTMFNVHVPFWKKRAKLKQILNGITVTI